MKSGLTPTTPTAAKVELLCRSFGILAIFLSFPPKLAMSADPCLGPWQKQQFTVAAGEYYGAAWMYRHEVTIGAGQYRNIAADTAHMGGEMENRTVMAQLGQVTWHVRPPGEFQRLYREPGAKPDTTDDGRQIWELQLSGEFTVSFLRIGQTQKSSLDVLLFPSGELAEEAAACFAQGGPGNGSPAATQSRPTATQKLESLTPRTDIQSELQSRREQEAAQLLKESSRFLDFSKGSAGQASGSTNNRAFEQLIAATDPQSPSRASSTNEQSPINPQGSSDNRIFQDLAANIGVASAPEAVSTSGNTPADIFQRIAVDVGSHATTGQPTPDPFRSLDPDPLASSLPSSSVSNAWSSGAVTSDGTPTDPIFANAFHGLPAGVGDTMREAWGGTVNALVSQGKSTLVSALGEAVGLSPDAIALGKTLLSPDGNTDSHSVVAGYLGGTLDPWREPMKGSATELAGYAKQAALLATGCNCDPFAGSLGDAVLAKAVGSIVDYGMDRVKQATTTALDDRYKQLTGGVDDPISNSALRGGQGLSAVSNPANALVQLKKWMNGNLDQLNQSVDRFKAEAFGFSNDSNNRQ